MSVSKAIIAGSIISITGVALLVAGVCAGIPEISEMKKNFTTYNTGTHELNSSSYEFDFSAGEITFHKSTTGKSYVDYSINQGCSFEGNDSSFKITGSKKWFFNFFGYNTIDVYISEETLENVKITMNAGEFKVEDSLKIKNFTLEANAGDFNISNITIDDAKIELNAGNIDIKQSNIKKLDFTVNAGNLDCRLVNPQNYYSISVSSTVGNVDLSPNNKKTQTGTEDGYSITGEVNVGNASIYFAN